MSQADFNKQAFSEALTTPISYSSIKPEKMDQIQTIIWKSGALH